ncbi:hypothetical protein [Streptomyces sp. NPDC048111]|uniref:hypothetical protein n=1 Tax=Streptomyces sp. NPDC048111 TaxID=3365500 RepID=UPI00371AE572
MLPLLPSSEPVVVERPPPDARPVRSGFAAGAREVRDFAPGSAERGAVAGVCPDGAEGPAGEADGDAMALGDAAADGGAAGPLAAGPGDDADGRAVAPPEQAVTPSARASSGTAPSRAREGWFTVFSPWMPEK